MCLFPKKKNVKEGKKGLNDALDKLVVDLKGARLRVNVDEWDYV